MVRFFLALAFAAFSSPFFAQKTTETMFGSGGIRPVRLTGFWIEHEPFMQRTSFGGNFLSRFSGSFEFNRAFEIGASVESSHSVFGAGTSKARLDWSDGWAAFLNYRFRPEKLAHPFVRASGGSAYASFSPSGSEDFAFLHFQAGIEANLFRWLRLGLATGYVFSEKIANPAAGELGIDGFSIGAILRVGILKSEK